MRQASRWSAGRLALGTDNAGETPGAAGGTPAPLPSWRPRLEARLNPQNRGRERGRGRIERLAASPGFAPGPPVSETSALLIRSGTGSDAKVVGSKTRRRTRTIFKLAAAAGNAPALPFSETGVQTSTLSGKMARRTVARERRLVAREGSAPPISGCRPDVILFHHRAVEARLAKSGCRGWIRYVSRGVMCGARQLRQE